MFHRVGVPWTVQLCLVRHLDCARDSFLYMPKCLPASCLGDVGASTISTTNTPPLRRREIVGRLLVICVPTSRQLALGRSTRRPPDLLYEANRSRPSLLFIAGARLRFSRPNVFQTSRCACVRREITMSSTTTYTQLMTATKRELASSNQVRTMTTTNRKNAMRVSARYDPSHAPYKKNALVLRRLLA
jgi:hypothetical protein